MKWAIGIDEVGRGALAGPVTVAAVMLAIKNNGEPLRVQYRSLKDSKKLRPEERKKWVRDFKSDSGIRFAVARVYPRAIETMNISRAANRAALRAFEKLSKTHRISAKTTIFLDGGLFLGDRSHQVRSFRNAKTIVKADEKIPAVAAASIIAKVARDRFMANLAKKYPRYGFDAHKGYGTRAHLLAIENAGHCPAHRLTFLRGKITINR